MTFAPDAAKSDAPRLYEQHSSNVCIDATVGDRKATEGAFARAAHIAKIKTWIPRIAGIADGAARAPSANTTPPIAAITIHTCNGSTRRLHKDLALTLDVAEDELRLVIRDVGGNFGTRGMIFAEQFARRPGPRAGSAVR